MKIVKILGGLGNQMFQFAFYLSLKKQFPNEVIRTDCSYFKGYTLHNGIELERIFGVQMDQASLKELLSVTWPLYNYRLYLIGKRIFPQKQTHYFEYKREITAENFSDKDVYFDGYWQSEFFFKDCMDRIKETYRFQPLLHVKNEMVRQEIKSVNSVSIHVRRGDYLKHAVYQNICEITYYQKAISYIIQKEQHPCFFVFSNDIGWCMEHLREMTGSFPVRYISWNRKEHSYVDMQLMAECKHNIIANSSFSWWGAWLNNNPKKIVITPCKWQNTPLKMPPQVVDGWVQI